MSSSNYGSCTRRTLGPVTVRGRESYTAISTTPISDDELAEAVRTASGVGLADDDRRLDDARRAEVVRESRRSLLAALYPNHTDAALKILHERPAPDDARMALAKLALDARKP